MQTWSMPEYSVAQIATFCEGQWEGDAERIIVGADTLDHAAENQLSFVADSKAFSAAAFSRAGCLLVPFEYADAAGSSRSLIRVKNPRLAFAAAVAQMYKKPRPAPAIHPTAVIAPTASIGVDCSIGPYVTIEEDAHIGPRCVIAAGCRIGARASVGADSALHSNVTLYDDVYVGARAILHAGCVLGADGFGFTLVGEHYEKFPQVGTVRIGDDVEIGAGSCVDRAALGVTQIGDGTKLDNLVHVGHNCTIGKHVVIAAQAGLSGSVTIGDHAAIGGQTGIGEKARIESKAVVGGKSGILTSQRIDAGEPVWGIPARPLRQHLKGLAHVARLGETKEQIQSIKQRVSELEKKISD